MQCASFLPGFFSSRDLTVADSGGAWTQYNTEKILNNVHSRNLLSPLLTIDQFSVYEKEVLRQTILQHESIFRDQVHELHRLYRRQREWMDEIKRRMLFDRNLQSDSTAFLPKISPETLHGTSQNPSLPCVNPTASRFPSSSAENFWSTSSFSELLHSKCQKPKKKMFDLELPAEEYIDSEEEDQFQESKVSEVSEMPCFRTKRIQDVSQKSDLDWFPCCDPSSRRNCDLADLNEPLRLEVAAAATSMDLNMPPSGSLDSNISQKDVRFEDGVKKHEDLKAVLPASSDKILEQDSSQIPKERAEDPPQRDLVFSQAFSTSVCNPEAKRFKTSDAFDDKDELYGEIIADNSILKLVNQIDLNCCVNEESSPELPDPVVTETVGEIQLEAPVSPENKECSPPRGESEENPHDTPIKLSNQEEDGEHEIDELVSMAAEAIVLISTPGFPKLVLENIVCERLEGSTNDSLDWFAEVVSSFAGDLENEIGVALGPGLSSDGSDYFEAMTFEFTETRVEEYWCQSTVRKEQKTSGVLLSNKPRRGRGRMRGERRKNFQVEVLPSLSSLSGPKLTEDFQTIGGMVEAAGFLAGTSPPGKRNVCSRARRRLGNSVCNGIEHTACSPMKQQNGSSCFALGGKSLKGWGKVNRRRRRGPRIPTTSTPPRLYSAELTSN